MLLKGVLDTECPSAAEVDQMLPEYRLSTKSCSFTGHVVGEWMYNSTHS